MSSQDEFVLTFTKNDLTLVEINGIALNFGSDTCQIKVRIVQLNTKSARKMSDVQLLFHALHAHTHTHTHIQRWRKIFKAEGVILIIQTHLYGDNLCL